jgi:uncharacterized membrane protein
MQADARRAPERASRGVPPVRRQPTSKVTVVAFLLALIGLALSLYLTVEHYGSSALLACPESATINCVKVTSSQWSVIAGVPVAVLGLIYYVVMVALTAPPAWRIGALRPVRLVGAVAGVVMVIYLVYVELFDVNAICLWCTGVHIATVALFGTVLWTSGAGPVDDRGSRRAPRR